VSQTGSSRLFREAALDRLSNPEQLDRIMTVARPADWLAFAALALLALTALGWSIFGEMATRVAGSGILVADGGAIFTPVANGDGVILEMLVAPGQQVATGAHLARVSQPDLEQQLASADALVAETNAQAAALRGQVGSYTSARAGTERAQRALLLQRGVDADARAKDVANQLGDIRQLQARGLVTRAHVSELAQQLAEAQQAATETRSKIVQINADEVSLRNGDDRELRAVESKMSEARRRQREIADAYDRHQWVTAPAAGRIVEIKAPVGSRVTAGMPVVAVENGSSTLKLILYVPPGEGKRVRTGMRVNVSPSVANREEFGTILGRVISVSDFPATEQAMSTTLQNNQLVKDFMAKGAPIVVGVRLDHDQTTVSGYAWAGSNGPAMRLTSGTIANADVTILHQAPITFALPFLRRSVGM
jgi:HlyD family secretion protein